VAGTFPHVSRLYNSNATGDVYGRKADAETAHVLNMDQARRIASNIAKLPKLLVKRVVMARQFPSGSQSLQLQHYFGLSNKVSVNECPSPVSPYESATANFFHSILNDVAETHWAA
jgi:hypothetical protein